jgi:hypothetical protein
VRFLGAHKSNDPAEKMMLNDAIKDELEKAIEEADRLSKEEYAVLEKAFKAATTAAKSDPTLLSDYRYKAVMQMVNEYIQKHNKIMLRYAKLNLKAQTTKAKAGR